VEVLNEIREPLRSVGVLCDLLLRVKFAVGRSFGDNFLLFGLAFFLGQIFLLKRVLAFLSCLGEFLSLGLASGMSSLQGVNNSLSLLVRSKKLLSAEGLNVRVKLDHNAEILERILLSLATSGSVGFRWIKARLDFARVDDSVKIRISHQWTRKGVSKFECGFLAVSSVELVKFLECGLSPDDESAEVTTGSQTKNVEAIDAENINTRKVTEGAYNRCLFVVDNQWTSSLNVSPVAALSLSSADLLAVFHFLHISISFDGFQELNSLRGLFQVNDRIVADNKRNF